MHLVLLRSYVHAGMRVVSSALEGICKSKLSDYDCGSGRDCDEAASVLWVNNQHPSEETTKGEKGRRDGVYQKSSLEKDKDIRMCVLGGSREGSRAMGTQPPETLHSMKFHA